MQYDMHDTVWYLLHVYWGGGLEASTWKGYRWLIWQYPGSKVLAQINSGTWNTAISKTADIFCIMARIRMWNMIFLIGDTFCIMVLYLFEYENKIWWKRLLNNGLPWVPYHYGTPNHRQICWIGGIKKKLLLVRRHAVWRGASSVSMRGFDAV